MRSLSLVTGRLSVTWKNASDISARMERKGLISDHGEKKKAWYILKSYYESIKNITELFLKTGEGEWNIFKPSKITTAK